MEGFGLTVEESAEVSLGETHRRIPADQMLMIVLATSGWLNWRFDFMKRFEISPHCSWNRILDSCPLCWKSGLGKDLLQWFFPCCLKMFARKSFDSKEFLISFFIRFPSSSQQKRALGGKLLMILNLSRHLQRPNSLRVLWVLLMKSWRFHFHFAGDVAFWKSIAVARGRSGSHDSATQVLACRIR